MDAQQKVLIVGGGFGGVKLAQLLSSKHLSNVSVRLVDPKSYMEYHAAVYRLVTGRSTAEVCIPYADLLAAADCELIRDRIVSVDPEKKVALGEYGSTYEYDTLVLAVGSETSYFDIRGVQENSHGIKTVDEALKLKRHLHDSFQAVKTATTERKVPLLHFVVIGGGASGVELAGELASYTKRLANMHGTDASFVTIDLIEATSKILGLLPEKVSEKVLRRLQNLGVNVYLSRSVIGESAEELTMRDMTMQSKTVVWTAGMKASSLTSGIAGIQTDKRGRVKVDTQMRATGVSDVFAIGDAASTKYSGMAQTALSDAAFVSRVIAAEASGITYTHAYIQPAPAYAVPVGPGWAAVVYHGMCLYGRLGWFLRRAADLRAFLSLLPPRAALRAFMGGFTRHEMCEKCS